MKVHENINRQRKIQEYMDAHGGQKPPDGLVVKLMKKACRCLMSKEKQMDMEAIARAQKESKDKMRKNEDRSKAQKKVAAGD